MKKIIFISAFLYIAACGWAQDKPNTKKYPKIPAIDVKTLTGKTFNTKDIANDGKPMIISLWATWCKPCVAELTAIDEVYADWVEETGVKLFAVSIDDSKTSMKVAPFVNGKNWDYVVLQDINGDFKRALNVSDVPYLCILNGEGEIVWQHTSYSPGSENEVYNVVKSLLAQ